VSGKQELKERIFKGISEINISSLGYRLKDSDLDAGWLVNILMSRRRTVLVANRIFRFPFNRSGCVPGDEKDEKMFFSAISENGRGGSVLWMG